jgi:hypothetical protein
MEVLALTDIALRALKPNEKPYIVSACGLYVEVFPTGGIVWRLRYRLNGGRDSGSVGSVQPKTLWARRASLRT